MPFKAPTIGIKDLNTAVTAALKNVPRDLVAGPKVVIRPEIIGIILREGLELKEALGAANTIARGVNASAKELSNLGGIRGAEPGLLVTKKGILAGFFPAGPMFEL
jgi:hypothetical protein